MRLLGSARLSRSPIDLGQIDADLEAALPY